MLVRFMRASGMAAPSSLSTGIAYSVSMARSLLSPPKASPGDKIAVLSPSFAAPGVMPAVHEQAMVRLAELTGLVPVEYPTTRQVNSTPQDRARDIMAAFADPSIKAIITTIGGDDQITVIPHIDPAIIVANPKPFVGYSDNTNLHHFLTTHGVKSFYGGSTQVHLGPGPDVEEEHLASLRAALLTGGKLEITNPSESEDHGISWAEPEALTRFGMREPAEPWQWSGPAKPVTGRTWGGCLEVVNDINAAGRFGMEVEDLSGSVLLLEMSEEVAAPVIIKRMIRALGERGVLTQAGAVLFARPPVSDFSSRPDDRTRAAMREDRYRAAVRTIRAYNEDAIICCGVPFGHTRPQWIVPYGGTMTVDGGAQRIFADYS